MTIKHGLGPDHIVSSVMIDADDPDNLVELFSASPLSFYGTGRPDTGYPELAGAPIGSTFTCTSDNAANYGAKQWQRFTVSGEDKWCCTQGQVGYNCPTVPGWSVSRTPYSLQLYFSINGVGAYEELPPFKTGTGWGLGTNQVSSFFANSPVSGRVGHVRFLGNGRSERAEGNTDRPQQILHNAPMFLTRTWPTGPAWDGAKSATQLRAELEAIKDDPEKADQLQALRDELAALTGTKPGALD